MNKKYHILLLYLIQVISIYNAIRLGYEVKKISNNTYEFTIKNKTICLHDFIDEITSFDLKTAALVS